MSGFSFNNQYNYDGHEHTESRRRRNAPRPQYQPLSNNRPYSYAAQARRRRQFGEVYGRWLETPTGMLVSRRASRIGRYSTMRPNRDTLLYGQRPVTLRTHNAGETNYNAVMRDQNQARYNPSFSNFFTNYTATQAYLDYQRGFHARPLSNRQFYGTARSEL